jgi:uridine kinase
MDGGVFLIGIGGGTCSGKTTLAQRLLRRCAARCVVIPIDNYYFELQGSLQERAFFNHDAPEAFNWPLLRSHLDALLAGRRIDMPIYDFRAFNQSGRFLAVEPRETIVLEGLYALFDESLRERMTVRVFLDSTAEQRLERRLRRDHAERCGSRKQILRKFYDTAEPAYLLRVEPTRRFAELVTSDINEAENYIIGRLRNEAGPNS